MSRFYVLSCAAVVLASLACGEQPSEVLVPARIEILTATSELGVGDTTRLAAQVTDRAGVEIPVRVSWSSSDASIVAVDSTGLTRGVAPGTATVSVRADNGLSAELPLMVVLSGLAPSGATLIDTSNNGTCALSATLVTYCWGRREAWIYPTPISALDLNSAALTPEALPLSVSLTSLQLATTDMCGLATAGVVYCWGRAPDFATYAGPVASSVVFTSLSVAAGYSWEGRGRGRVTTCGIDTRRVLYCWGDGSQGQLGDGRSGPGVFSDLPVRVQLPEAVAAVDVASQHVCAVTVSGSVFCWGRTGPWLGAGEATWGGVRPPRLVSSQVKFTAVSTWDIWGDFAGRTCAIAESGAAYCWGTAGYFPRALNGVVAVPREVDGAAAGRVFRGISVGEDYTCGVERSGGATCWGTLKGVTPEPIPATLSFVAVTVGESHACGITTSGEAYCWGSRILGQLGDGFSDFRPLPVAVAGGLSFRSITETRAVTCGVTVASLLYCWGGNSGNQLGDGTTIDRRAPTPVAPERRFQSVSAGYQFVCALDVGGKPYCWGTRSGGFSAALPSAISTELEFTEITTGSAHACAIARDATAHCWGDNQYGQLGTGDLLPAHEPRAVVGGLRFTGLHAEGAFTCGVTTSGEVFCWGAGGNISDFGTASPGMCPGSTYEPCSSTPVRIGPVTDAVEIGDRCYLDKLGHAYCWGLTSGGGSCLALGGKGYACVRTPVRVGTQRVRELRRRAVLDENGVSLFVVPTSASSFSFVAAPGDFRFASHSGGRAVYAGEGIRPDDHACGITGDGRAFCWGDNTFGQIGDGEPVFATRPVRVLSSAPFATPH